EVAPPGRLADREADRLTPLDELDALERQLLRGVARASGLGERLRQPLVVERRAARALHRVDEDELPRPAAQVVAVPEARAVGEPVRRDLSLVDAAGRLAALGPLGRGVPGVTEGERDEA